MKAEAAAPSASGAAPDGGDGSQPSGDDHVEAVGAADDAGDGARSDDDDSDDDDDYSDVPFNEHPRFKALTRKLSKTKKQLARFRPLAERVKDVNVDELSLKARTADQLQEVLSKNPKLRQQMLEAMARPDAGNEPEPEPEFDPSKLPFDTSDESGKFFAAWRKEFLDLKKENARLAGELKSIRETGAQQQRAVEVRSWKSAVEAAQAHVPEHFREMFNDAVYGAFREAKERGVRLDPQKVIDHYLKKAGINKGTQAKASAAAAQRIAEQNKKLPQQPAKPGVAAAAKGDRKETVADVSKRLRRQFA